jgi:hypothetical protein
MTTDTTTRATDPTTADLELKLYRAHARLRKLDWCGIQVTRTSREAYEQRVRDAEAALAAHLAHLAK